MKALMLTVAVLCSAACAPPVRAAERAPWRSADAFRAACAALADAADKADRMVVAGRDDWRFLTKELRHVGVGEFWGGAAVKVSRANNPKYADPLPAIVDFNDQLKKLGIELLLVPVPPKAVVYPGNIRAGIWGGEAAAAPRRAARNVLQAAPQEGRERSRPHAQAPPGPLWRGVADILQARLALVRRGMHHRRASHRKGAQGPAVAQGRAEAEVGVGNACD